MPFVELAARSHFSLLDGASSPAEMVEVAQAYGHAGIGIADTNSFAGVVRGHVAARELKTPLPFTPGMRLLLLDGQAYMAWPTSRAGYGRLTRLISEARMAAPKGECPVTRDAMLAAAQGLLTSIPEQDPETGAPDAGAHHAPIPQDRSPGWVMAFIPPEGPLDEAFADRFHADAEALSPHLVLPLLCLAPVTYRGDDQARLDRLAAVAGRDNLLASTDPRYHLPDRRRLADVLTAIRLHRTVDDLGFAAEPNAERRLKPLEEMERLFARYPEALSNSLRVQAACQGFSLDQLRYEYPLEIMEPGYTAQQTLERRVEAAVAHRWPEGITDTLRARLREELTLIEQLGYAPYFLTVHEIVLFARSQGILCQGRGSAANSSTCYVLNITAIDPDKMDLLFARFLSESRNEPPDIDVDFEHERREEVIQHIYKRYGRHRAAICATVICYRSRSAIREVGKALGLSEDVTGRLAKGHTGPGRDDTLAELAESAGYDTKDQRLAMALELAEELRGFPRHLATHVGGFVITQGPLVDLAIVTNAAMENRTTLEWDKDDIDALKILKVDVLGLGMLTCLKRGFEMLDKHKRLSLELDKMAKDDEATYAMLRRADSVGVFQVESRAQMNMLPRLKPKEFYDLVVQVAIVRPGPIQGGMVHPYLRRRDRLEKATYPEPADPYPKDELKGVLGKTLGVPLFQEQVMRLAIVAAEYTDSESDSLRRAMATFKHTGTVGNHYERLTGGMTRRGYTQEFADRIFEQIKGFADYGFPESHAASFAHLVYASAWIKCHHPGVFACALLNSQPMGFYAPAQIVRDAKEHGVVINPIDVNASGWDSSMEDDEASTGGLALRLGLRLVNGLSDKEGQAISDARWQGNGVPYIAVEEIGRRAGASRKALQALSAADAFHSLGDNRREAAWAARAIEPGELPLFAGHEGTPLIAEPTPSLPAMQEGEGVIEDYAATGMTLARHPMALLRADMEARGYVDTRRLRDLRAGSRIRLAGLVLMRQRPGTAKGIIFVTLEDEFGVANLVVYADIAARDRQALLGSRLLMAEGRVERVDKHAEVPLIHLVVRRLEDVTEMLDGLVAGEVRMPISRDFR